MENPLADPPMELDWPAPLMTAAEVAVVLRVTPKTVRQHIRRGSLRALQIDGSGPYRVRAEDAQRWADAMATGPRGGTQAVDSYARERLRATRPAAGGRRRRRRSRRVSRASSKPDLRSIETRRRERRDGTTLVTYRVRWTGPGGQRERRTFDDLDAATAFRDDLDRRAALIADGPAARATMTVADCYEQWVREHVRPQLAARTIRNYEGFWSRHLCERIGGELAVGRAPE